MNDNSGEPREIEDHPLKSTSSEKPRKGWYTEADRLKITGNQPTKGLLVVEPQYVNIRMTRSTFKQQQQQERKGKRKIQKELTPEELKKLREESVVNRFRLKRQFTNEEREAYQKKLEESGGFDVGHIPDGVNMNSLIAPVWDENSPYYPPKRLLNMAELALTNYNRKKRTHYHFVELIRVNGKWVGKYLDYYITFQAEDKILGYPARNFQAIVWAFMGQTTVRHCKLELPKYPKVAYTEKT